MNTKHFQHRASDGANINVYCWLPDGAPRRLMHIVHGMAEHAGRYTALAESLTNAGYAVFAHDLRGHGQTGYRGHPGHPGQQQGHFADTDGWQRVIADVREIHELMRSQHPQLGVVLFGHSMGSFIAQDCVARFGSQLDAVVLSATDMPPTALRLAGQLAAWIERKRQGPDKSSALLQTLSFGNFNRPFVREDGTARSEFEWLSADTAEVDKYIDDPDCGFACTTETWWQLLGAIGRVQARSSIQAMPANLPMLLIAGSEDPVARNGKGPQALATKYRRMGITDVSTKIIAGGRHELLNDQPREQVINDMLAWLDRRLNT